MRRPQIALLAAFLAIGVLACGDEEAPVATDSSVVSEGTYTNEYFGLTLSIPDGWFVASRDTQQSMSELGKKLVAGDDATLEAVVEQSQKNTFQLLTVSEFEVGAAVDFNPTLILVAERVSHMPGVKSGRDYLFHARKLLLRSQLPYELIKDTFPTQLGGREWYRADYIVNNPQMPVEQSYFATKHDDFVLVVILSASTKEQMVALERIADSITM